MIIHKCQFVRGEKPCGEPATTAKRIIHITSGDAVVVWVCQRHREINTKVIQ